MTMQEVDMPRVMRGLYSEWKAHLLDRRLILDEMRKLQVDLSVAFEDDISGLRDREALIYHRLVEHAAWANRLREERSMLLKSSR